jgi:hypothetical protein
MKTKKDVLFHYGYQGQSAIIPKGSTIQRARNLPQDTFKFHNNQKLYWLKYLPRSLAKNETLKDWKSYVGVLLLEGEVK